MSIQGQAVLAMWWDISTETCPEFEHWHAHEHFPERLGIPGFRRATRWKNADGGEGVFVMYELQDHHVLSSAPYLARLNAPTPWSTRMMPHHRNMVRSQCRVLESHGGGIARHAMTLRLSPAPGQGDALRSVLSRLAAASVTAPGLCGVHLLRHEAPPIAPTQEQKIRGLSDRVADWVLVACGYELDALRSLSDQPLGEAHLREMGAAPGAERAFFTLSQSAVPGDLP